MFFNRFSGTKVIFQGEKGVKYINDFELIILMYKSLVYYSKLSIK